MPQFMQTHGETILRHPALLAACLALAIAVGCHRETPSGPKGPTPVEQAAQSKEAGQDKSKPTTGRDVLNRMVAAYRKASSYADAGTVRLLAESDGRKVREETANFSCALLRPNKLRMQAYDAMLVCDGQKCFAAIEGLPGQVVLKQAPTSLSMRTLDSDPVLIRAMTQGFGGGMPQPVLLMADDPLKALLPGNEEPVLSETGQIEGRDCYRVKVTWPEGVATLWIDKESFVLRRMLLPTEELRRAMGREQAIDNLSLVAEFTGAQIDGTIAPKAFEYETPKGAEIVKFFVLPNPAQLLSKKTPGFKFSDLNGKPVTPESLAGKVTVLDFWATWCEPCRESLPNLEKVYQRFKNNPKVTFCAVSVDEPQTENKNLVKAFEQLKVTLPILRDTEQSAAALRFVAIPTMIILGSDGVVQDCESGANPKLADLLPKKIDKLLAGENIYEEPLKAYHEEMKEYAAMVEAAARGEPAPGAGIREEKLPEVKTAPRSEPATFKLKRLWKCAEAKSPANILVVKEKNGPSRLLVVEGFKSVAEVGLDGKLVALHKLNLDESEAIGSLRAATGADGKRYVVAFLTTQQRCHILDENWNHVASYPEDALKNRHSGIADVELGDLDGDGKLKMYLSYLGAVGVQAVPLPPDGKPRLWTNRSLSNAAVMAIGGADPKGRRDLFCTNNNGTLVVLNAEGQRRGEITIPNRMLGWIAAADLRGNGQVLWCGLAAAKFGEDVAVGLSLDGRELWKYPLPQGFQPQPIDRIIVGRITRDGPGQWILPGPDGSIHFVAADGKPWDKFNYGAMLNGLATVEIDGQPALVVSSANGLEAWKVE
jgi:thiol-disulfide isomerase/thioredoxin